MCWGISHGDTGTGAEDQAWSEDSVHRAVKFCVGLEILAEYFLSVHIGGGGGHADSIDSENEVLLKIIAVYYEVY